MKRLYFLMVLFTSVFQSRAQNCLDFDGSNDYVDCGNDTSVQISGQYITLEAWINPTAWKTNAYEGNIICKEYNTSNYGYMLRCGASGSLNFAIGDGKWHEITTASSLLSLNTWQHVAGTFDGNKMRVYINGVAVDSLAFNGQITATPNVNLFIGAHVTYSRFYQGQIDEVRIWNKCRTESELYSNMGSEFCGTVSGLKAYYKFNQGKASQANGSVKKLNDLSGFYNNGTLNNFGLSGSTSNWIKGRSYLRAAVYKQDTADVCNTYTSPSKRFTWTTSGNYNDTLNTFFGCDSVIQISLKVRKSTTSVLNIYACDSFKSPSGLYVWKKSGIYFDKIKNVAKCDSSITIKLTIGGSRDTIQASACEKFISPKGITYTQSGIYPETYKNYRNCDSIICIKLNIKKSSTATLNETACQLALSPSKKHVWRSTGTYKDTLTNFAGCDSFLTVNLKILNSSSVVSFRNCLSVKSPSKRYTWTISGTYGDTISNRAGCDSFITAHVIILHPSSAKIDINACRSYKSPLGKTYTKSGIIKETLVNFLGCDSLLSINLSIPFNNTQVTQDGKHLAAVAGQGAYQWLNCDNAYSPVSGENQNTFTAKAIGNYAVEIKDSGCADTSQCYLVNSVGLDKNFITLFSISPNPSDNGIFTINTSAPTDDLTMTLTDLNGQTILTLNAENKTTLDLSHLPKGLYLLNIHSETQTATFKLITH